MKFIIAFFLLCSIAHAAATTTAPSVDAVLDALDARGKDLKTLSADVKMSDIDPSIGDVSDVRTGRFYYEVASTGDARWHALFDKKIVGKTSNPVKHEWAYADGKVVDRDYRMLRQTTHQILKPGEKMQLFNLEGPFPLPLGQDKADVHKHFDVQQQLADKDDPPGTTHLTLTPVAGSNLARKFKTIDLWFDPTINMPTRITVLDANQTSMKQTDLSNVRVNQDVKDNDLDMEKIDTSKGWDLKDEGS